MDSIDIRQNVIEAAFGLARAIRRGPKPMEHDLPMPVERTLSVISKNDGLTAGELCELLDMRPSSVSELTDKMAERGLIEKAQDEADKRVSRITLTELGKAQASRIEEVRSEALNSFSACFTDEEAAQFCELAGKLSAHLKETAGEGPKDCGCHHGPHGHGPHGHGPMGGPGCGHHGPHGHGHGCGPHKGPHWHGPCMHHPMHRL